MKRKIRIVLSIFLLIFPWQIRRAILNSIFGYSISPTAKIGFSIIAPDILFMGEFSRIGHFTFCNGINNLEMGKYSLIGSFNWIAGYPLSKHTSYAHRVNRNPSLILKNHSAITNRHIFDCTDEISIGEFSIIAGDNSQLLTHSINITKSIQDCNPIRIGSYCFIGTSCTILPSTEISNYIVIGACSLVNQNLSKEFSLFGGVPAKYIKDLSHNCEYFIRTSGYVF